MLRDLLAPGGELLLLMLGDEINRRESTAASRRAVIAGLEPEMMMERWDKTAKVAMFDDVMLAQSAVDRFKNAAYDLVMDGESYRPKQQPTVRADDPRPPPAQSKKPVVGCRRTLAPT